MVVDGLLDILLSIVVDGAAAAAEDRRTPLWLRILLAAVLLAFFLGLSFLLIGAETGTGNWLLAALGVLFLAGGAGLVLHKLRKRKQK